MHGTLISDGDPTAAGARPGLANLSDADNLPTARPSMAMTPLGLRFLVPEVERLFREWQEIEVLPVVRFGTIAAITSWVGGLPGFWVAARPAFSIAGTWVALVVSMLLLCLWLTYRPTLRRWVLPASAAVNVISGFAVIGIGFWAQPSPGVVSSVLIVIAFFGLTIFRLYPLQGAIGVGAYVVVSGWLTIGAHRDGLIELYDMFYYLFMPIAAYATGMVICIQMWRMSREAYRRSRIITEQQEKLEAERALSDELLLNILPAGIAQELKYSPGLIAQHCDGATVLFADIVGFTPLAAKLHPDAVVTLLNEIFSHFDALAENYGVEKIKTIGDAYMAVAGLPDPNPRHAVAAAEMALGMRESITGLAAARHYGINLRIGLATGPLVAGVIGTRRFAYDLWGDTVNTAARMESHGVPGQIQIDQRTQQALYARYQTEYRGRIHIKGKGTMPTWLLLARLDHRPGR